MQLPACPSCGTHARVAETRAKKDRARLLHSSAAARQVPGYSSRHFLRQDFIQCKQCVECIVYDAPARTCRRNSNERLPRLGGTSEVARAHSSKPEVVVCIRRKRIEPYCARKRFCCRAHTTL